MQGQRFKTISKNLENDDAKQEPRLHSGMGAGAGSVGADGTMFDESDARGQEAWGRANQPFDKKGPMRLV